MVSRFHRKTETYLSTEASAKEDHLKSYLKGFTFVEIMVVLGITLLLAGIAISYSQESRQLILLNSEKVKIAESISKTKALAITGYTKPASLPPPCAYGFEVNYTNQTFSIFFINKTATFSCLDVLSLLTINASVPITYVDGYPQKIDKNIKISPHPTDGLLYAIFIPPNLDVALFDSANSRNSFSSLGIDLEAKSSPSIKGTVTVSQNGYLSF
ncbi:MAG: prepilin-type N-terminal cleavage/methylation domain-containing protein [Candidatus Paceibacterota bacterium]